MIASVLISVVIPAFNASSTIDETLRSVRSQSHELLEIIVVDDGSTDDTLVIVQGHVEEDSRVRVIKQENAGVAAARNAGWRAARADLIAFIDADDLWAVTKIESQLQVMKDTQQKIGLVYSWYCWIDAESRVLAKCDQTFHCGSVLDKLFEGNFVGNGSSVLVRREALIAANGFDSRLRALGAEGCEDFRFYCCVAEKFQFAVVPEYQIGYRYLPTAMSADLPRMFRSMMIVVDEMAARHPDRILVLNRGLKNYARWLLRRALVSGQFRTYMVILTLMSERGSWFVFQVFMRDLPRDVLSSAWWLLSRRPNRGSIARFPIGGPGVLP